MPEAPSPGGAARPSPVVPRPSLESVPMPTSPLPVPAALADLLALAGLRGSITIERLDGGPPSREQEQLARGLVQKHGQPMSDADVAAKAKAYLQRQGAAAPAPAVKPARASGKVTGRSKAPSKAASAKPRKASKAPARKAARRPARG